MIWRLLSNCFNAEAAHTFHSIERLGLRHHSFHIRLVWILDGILLVERAGISMF